HGDDTHSHSAPRRCSVQSRVIHRVSWPLSTENARTSVTPRGSTPLADGPSATNRQAAVGHLRAGGCLLTTSHPPPGSRPTSNDVLTGCHRADVNCVLTGDQRGARGIRGEKASSRHGGVGFPSALVGQDTECALTYAAGHTKNEPGW